MRELLNGIKAGALALNLLGVQINDELAVSTGVAGGTAAVPCPWTGRWRSAWPRSY